MQKVVASHGLVILSSFSGNVFAASPSGKDKEKAFLEETAKKHEQFLNKQFTDLRNIENVSPHPNPTTPPTKSTASTTSTVSPMSTGQQNLYTWTVGTGTTTMSGAWYFNNDATYTWGSASAESHWDSSLNACYAYAQVNGVWSNADAWCDLGNVFDFKPNAAAGTLVNVNVQAEGTIRGRVAAGALQGSGSSQLRVVLHVYDMTSWSEMNACTIGTWNNPAAGWTDAVTSYRNTCSMSLESGKQYVAFVGVDTNANSVGSMVTLWADANPSGPAGLTDKKVTMTQMVITSN